MLVFSDQQNPKRFNLQSIKQGKTSIAHWVWTEIPMLKCSQWFSGTMHSNSEKQVNTFLHSISFYFHTSSKQLHLHALLAMMIFCYSHSLTSEKESTGWWVLLGKDSNVFKSFSRRMLGFVRLSHITSDLVWKSLYTVNWLSKLFVILFLKWLIVNQLIASALQQSPLWGSFRWFVAFEFSKWMESV